MFQSPTGFVLTILMSSFRFANKNSRDSMTTKTTLNLPTTSRTKPAIKTATSQFGVKKTGSKFGKHDFFCRLNIKQKVLAGLRPSTKTPSLGLSASPPVEGPNRSIREPTCNASLYNEQLLIANKDLPPCNDWCNSVKLI